MSHTLSCIRSFCRHYLFATASAVLLLTICTTLFPLPSKACTAVIISSRVAQGHRPILFKNRDTPNVNNAVRCIAGERYRFVGVVAADDNEAQEVWGGHNEAGFAIINTAAYNLNGCAGLDSHHDGQLMRRALELCATLDDFEQLLDTLTKPMDLNSNFGVIDARGGCAWYETNDNGYVKFDANDPATAPHGYLTRTNHGMTGCHDNHVGVERYMAIEQWMKQAYADNTLSATHLIVTVPRHLTHGLTGINLFDLQPASAEDTKMCAFRDFIPRWNTASAILIEGVKQGESPLHTISWTNIGWPPAAVALPIVITPSGAMPTLVVAEGNKGAWLTQQSLLNKQQIFCAQGKNKNDYINLAPLINRQHTGIMQQVMDIEQEVMRHASTFVDNFRKTSPNKSDPLAKQFYQWADQYIRQHYPTPTVQP